MKKFIIKNIDKYNYELESNNRVFKVNIEFYNLSFEVNRNDTMYIPEEMLNDIKNFLVNFELINDSYNILQKDIVVLIHDNQKYFLKRVYG